MAEVLIFLDIKSPANTRLTIYSYFGGQSASLSVFTFYKSHFNFGNSK